MGCDYGVALALFEEDRWAPEDNTRAHWYRRYGEIHYSDNDEGPDPDEWDGGGYGSERVRSWVVKGDYLLITADDDCGGQYQAIFKMDMEIKDE